MVRALRTVRALRVEVALVLLWRLPRSLRRASRRVLRRARRLPRAPAPPRALQKRRDTLTAMTRAVLALVLALTSTACSGGSKRVGGTPSWRSGKDSKTKTPPGPITFAPKTEAVARYNEPVQAPPKSALGDAVVAAVKDTAAKQNLPLPTADAR